MNRNDASEKPSENVCSMDEDDDDDDEEETRRK